VELAQLSHLSTRLGARLTHLERQKGGIGLRGPGETQLETDRRLIAKRIRTLRARLEKPRASATPDVTCDAKCRCRRSRSSGIRTRASPPCSTGSRAATLCGDQLFATWIRPFGASASRGRRGGARDTVGFVRALPTNSSRRFAHPARGARGGPLAPRRRASDPLRDERMVQVRDVLAGIGAGTFASSRCSTRST